MFSRLTPALGAGLAVALVAPLPASATVSTTPDVVAKVAGIVHAVGLVDPDDNPATVDSKAYLGGVFTAVGGQARSNVAMVKADGKVDLTFKPTTNGKVLAVAASEDGSTVFLGGTFTEVNGTPRANLAAVDAVTGQLVETWQADTGGTTPDVASLAVKGSVLYVGGRFATIDSTNRKRLAAVNTATGVVDTTSFRPNFNGGVREVVVSPDGSTVFAGGAFTAINNQPRLAAGAVSAATGAPTSFSPSGSGGNAVSVALSPTGDRFFYSTENNTLFAHKLNDPNVNPNNPAWSIKTSGNTQAIVAVEDEMWIGGHFSQIVTGHIARPFVASIDPVDGSVNDWNSQCVGGKIGVWALAHDGKRLHLGGAFTGFGTVKQRGYARFTQIG